MQLIGYMDSPFVRRVAVSAQFLGIPYEQRELSIFRDFDEFSAINPLVKVPTLICDNGEVLGTGPDQTNLRRRGHAPADCRAAVHRYADSIGLAIEPLRGSRTETTESESATTRERFPA